MPGVKSAYRSWSAGADRHFSHFERGGKPLGHALAALPPNSRGSPAPPRPVPPALPRPSVCNRLLARFLLYISTTLLDISHACRVVCLQCLPCTPPCRHYGSIALQTRRRG